ncbi:hypothetical protein PVAND_013757 [Polypedilum vanderplanki]|uniref:F-box domain-containing protein n=1 Tax=Polypedilum vanderplanki TaxID=319348 RepID=A0A9J6CQN9_POLVA|nr:hypothetical protein PVAND_013757 [Polypedilum vanderplanki]
MQCNTINRKKLKMEDNNDEIEFRDIPDEVLQHLFFYLSPKMLKVCTLVCKRWNKVIENSHELMSQFVLNIEDKSNFEIAKAQKIYRNHYSIKTFKLTTEIKEIIVAHRLRHLHISNCTLHAEDLNECLKDLGILESFTGKTIKIQEKSLLKRAKFKRLKKLHIDFSDIDLILVFDTDALDTAYFATSSEDRGSAVLQILWKQVNLKDLTIGGYLANNFLKLNGVCEIALNTLERFRIERGPNKTIRDFLNDPLIKFLTVHQASLISLELIYPVDLNIYKFVLNHMPNLKYLDIPVTTLSELKTESFNLLERNNVINSIRFVGQFKNLPKATAIVDLCPSLTSIDMSDLTISSHFMLLLFHLSQNHSQIEVLKIPNLLHDYHNGIYFPHLKEFFVKTIPDQEHYCKFIQQHSKTLEKVTIANSNDDNFLKFLVIEQITACPNIKYISISAQTSIIMRKFNKLVDTNHEWTLVVNFRGPSELKFVTLKFNFPQDCVIFQDKVMVHSEEMIRNMHTLEDMGLNRFVNKYK